MAAAAEVALHKQSDRSEAVASVDGSVRSQTNQLAHRSGLDSMHLLYQIHVGSKLAVYLPDDDAYYNGTVAEHHPDQSDHVYTVHYDDGEVGQIDLAAESFRIIEDDSASHHATTPAIDGVSSIVDKSTATTFTDDGHSLVIKTSLRGDRKPQSSPPNGFLLDDFEIYWGDGISSGWRPYFSDQDKISFYSCSFQTQRCEVEWNRNGCIHDTHFRKAGPRKRKRVCKDIKEEAPTKSPPPSRPKPKKKPEYKEPSPLKPTTATAADAGVVSPEHHYEATLGLGPNSSKSHYITDKLACTREELIASLPDEMKRKFNDCCWVSWKGLHRPALILSPFEVTGDSGIVEQWTSTYLSYKKDGNLSQLPYLIYWYEEGWSHSKDFKAFSLIKKADLIPYGIGLSQGWDKPSFANKVDDPFTHGTLTEQEDNILKGIKLMNQDDALPKESRGGPMFFPHLRTEEKVASDKVINNLKMRYRSWSTSANYTECVANGSSRSSGEKDREASQGDPMEEDKLTSLELCAGEEVMSRALSKIGFITTTLDNDLKRSAASKLSLDELERRIASGHINDHPHLDKSFSVIWAAPECRTWSRAQNGRYRNKHFVDGFIHSALEAHAQQARRDIESLVNILSFYKAKNPNLVVVIENPLGYLHLHPVSRLFNTILGLQLIKISYCKFTVKDCPQPKKDTHLWTNSDLLLHQFCDGKFECKRNMFCKGKAANGRHISQVQDFSDRCSAYPTPMCMLIAPLLFAEAISRTLGAHDYERRSSSSHLRTDDEGRAESSDST